MPEAPETSEQVAAEEAGPESRTAWGEYAQASRTPLHILAFLLPIIVVYEVGLALQHEALAGTGGVRAWAMLARVMETLGVSPSAVVGYSLPAAAIIIVLLLWHVFEKQRWRVRPAVVLLMAAETVAWMVPLLLFAGVLTRVIGDGSGTTSPQPMSPTTLESLEGLGWQARLVIALGAGLYEELLFRMALLALLHAVLAELLKLGPKLVFGIALPVSALAFALYHDVWTAGGVDVSATLLYFAGGLYLGVIYLLRGFGLAVGVHACYNTTVLVLLGPV
ncbi:MAG: CPBP family intramembrane metalloprotease [Phycisphaerales bacterium]|nr:CPBP family intramembrane metalloprotease [Phycisphaerales bacterium]